MKLKRAASTGDAISNSEIAQVLRDVAELLRSQGANPFRVNAYKRAANTLDELDVQVAAIVARQGFSGLLALPNIGRGLSATIEEIVRTGRSTLLDRLRGETDPEALLQTVPGIGPAWAHRIHEALHIDTLEELELAAHDGRLDDLSGFGERRVAAIRASVASQLARRAKPALAADIRQRQKPPVGLLLQVDRAYRERALAGTLPTIAPRRFNPEQAAWLPLLHTDREGWHFTALFSNTERAHRLGMTQDWVVIYFYDHDHRESQHTVVTETHGPLTGRRVVRGREAECKAHYEAAA